MNGPISLNTLLVVFILVDEVPEKDFAFSHPVHLSRLNTGRGSMQCLDAVWRRRVNVAIGISAITIGTCIHATAAGGRPAEILGL